MDLRSFKIHGGDRHVRAVLGDHRGAQARDLEGAAFERVWAAAGSLLARLADEAGAAVRALSVDGVGRALRLTTDTAPPRPLVLTGPQFEAVARDIAPLARAILAEVRARSDDLAGATPSQAAFWEHLYRDDDAGWEIGRAAPPLAAYFKKRENSPAGLRTLVIGCGRGHEARLLAGLGARVTAIDLATRAIAAAQAATPADVHIDFRVHDLFAPLGQRFDLVVEHTCFCAIEPTRRDEYVQRVADLLDAGGALVGLFYDHGRAGGPPHTTSAEELRERFEGSFVIEALAPAEGSVLAREGQELLGRFVRRPA
jgi:SAM-dependent methyltransferase